MNATRWMIRAVVTVTWLASVAPAWPQLDRDIMKIYGGTYMSDCGNNASPRVTVFADALVFLSGDKRVAGTSNVLASASYFGNSPPPNYRMTLQSELQGGAQLLFMVYADRVGEYITLDGDPKIMAMIGRPAAALKYRRCGAAAVPSTPPSAPTLPPARRFSEAEMTASGMLLNPRFKAAYYRALGPLRRVPWLAELGGPSPQNKRVTVAGAEYLLVSACKDHDCADNNTVLLWSGPQGVVYGAVYLRGRPMLIGSPSPAIARELGRLWRAEWRQKQ